MSGESVVTAMETTETEETNHNSIKTNSKNADTTEMELKILAAMRSRVTYLRNKADSVTFASVRRLIEEDMGLEKFALDVHKSFVKQHLVQCLEDDDVASENPQEAEMKDDVTEEHEVKNDVREETGDDEETAGDDGGRASENPQETEMKDDVTEEHEVKNDEREESGDDDDVASDNPQEAEMKDDVTEEHEVKNDVREETGDDEETVAEEDTKDEGNREDLMSDVKRALWKRASYIKANLEEITMGSLRRLLEEDLKLEKDSLVPFKKFINEELDAVLKMPDAPKPSTKPTGKNVKKKVKNTPSKKVVSEENSDSDGEDDVDDEEVAVKKNMTQKRKRKVENAKPVAGKKKAKHAETDSENDSDAGDSEMRVEKPLKAKETTTTVYGKRVEHLKSVIKSCGMSVPPVIYRKVKQAPEEKREATLIEELKQILAKEGLSSDPSEKEIKEVKKKKTISKELEGIDTSNIVSSSRRRSTTSFVPPPKPKITSESESESDEPEESENGEDNEEEEEVGNEEAEEVSQSEEESNNEDDGGEESE